MYILLQFVKLFSHGLKVEVWRALSTCLIIGSVFFEKKTNSEHYVKLILVPVLGELTQEEEI
jgi:hypothetical protein